MAPWPTAKNAYAMILCIMPTPLVQIVTKQGSKCCISLYIFIFTVHCAKEKARKQKQCMILSAFIYVSVSSYDAIRQERCRFSRLEKEN